MVMKILSSRFIMLQYILDAYDKVKVPLIGFDGTSLIPFTGTAKTWTGSFDDSGIFILIPNLVHFFNLSLQQGIDLFFYGIKYGAFFCGLLGLLLLYTSWTSRLVSCLGILFLLRISIEATDVYLTYLAALLGTVPLLLYCIEKLKNFRLTTLFIFVASCILMIFNYIRSHSGLPAFAFMIAMIFLTQQLNYKKKGILLAVMLLGCAVPRFYFNNALRQYHEYAYQNFKDMDEFPTKHPFWHTVYAGFGLLKWMNKDNIDFDDKRIFDMVDQKAPGITLFQIDTYENCVKDEVINLVKSQTFFVLVTLFAKLGILFFYLLKLAHVGLFAAYLCPKPWYMECAFLVCFACSSLFPLITLPQGNYSLSFITLCVLYGIMSINYFLEHNVVGVRTRFKKFFTQKYVVQ
jgi:hypothetical protein